MINLFYLSGNTTGGWVTFTYHLYKSLTEYGQTVRLFKVHTRTERNTRPFGYGLHYRNITLADATLLDGEIILTAVAKNFAEPAAALLEYGAKLVLHDPTELRAGLAGLDIRQPWVIRKAVAAQVEGARFIRHPYTRHYMSPVPVKRKGAVSVSRIDFDKHTDIILDANRLGAGIRIFGFENRLYTRFKIVPKYPEWEQSKCAYPRDADTAYQILAGADFAVDMSLIKGDGGGTQYTTLEAWDAGAVPVIQADWLHPRDDMLADVNCIPVVSAPYLAKIVRGRPDLSMLANLRENGYKSLKRHAPRVIGPQIMEWLNGKA